MKHLKIAQTKVLNGQETEDLYTCRALIANTLVDADYEKFSVSFLHNLAATLPGKSVIVGHDKSGLPVGKVQNAEVMGEELYGDLAFLPEDNLVPKIKAGIVDYVSIGFCGEECSCSICGKNMYGSECQHYPGKAYEGQECIGTWVGDGESLELSLVYLGAQKGARIVQKAPVDWESLALQMVEIVQDKDLEYTIREASYNRLAKQYARMGKAAPELKRRWTWGDFAENEKQIYENHRLLEAIKEAVRGIEIMGEGITGENEAVIAALSTLSESIQSVLGVQDTEEQDPVESQEDESPPEEELLDEESKVLLGRAMEILGVRNVEELSVILDSELVQDYIREVGLQED